MSKSVDQKVTTDLIETLKDGVKGFAEAADKLADSDRPELAAKFKDLSTQRSGFALELETIAAAYGDDIDEDGSVAAAVHRGWMSIKDAVTGSSPSGVLDVAVGGEQHAVTEYEKALDEDISADLRATVRVQYLAVKSAAAEVEALRASAA